MREIVQIEKKIQKEFPELVLESGQIQQLYQYLTLLHQWNKKINLTSIRDIEGIFFKHIIDSMALFKKDNTIQLHGKVLDMGSGGGLPGIVLKICCPEISLYSVDKVKKKIIFQDVVKSQLKLNQFFPVADNLEKLGQQSEFSGTFDFVVTRALDQVDGLLEYSDAFLKPDGKIIMWKGERMENEINVVRSELRDDFKITQQYLYNISYKDLGGTIVVWERLKP